MDIHLLIVLILLGSLAVAIIQKLLYAAIIVVVVAFAYYTGIAQGVLEIVVPLITQLLPESWQPEAFIGLIRLF